MIVETKGSLYANDPKFQDKRRFTEKEFIRMNNGKPGVPEFEYLYLEDGMEDGERIKMVHKKLLAFFKEG